MLRRIIRSWRTYFEEIRLGGPFLKSEFVSVWKVAFTATVFGWFWQLVLPVVPLTVYVFLASIKVLPVVDGMPPSVYIIFGFIAWALMSESLLGCVRSLQKYASIFNKTTLPLSVLMSTSVSHRLVELLIQSVVALGIAVYWLEWGVLQLPLALMMLAPGWVLVFSLGSILAYISTFAPDLVKVVEITHRYLIFLSAVIFPLPPGEMLEWWTWVNPYINFIEAFRNTWYYGLQEVSIQYLTWSVVGILLFAVQMILSVRLSPQFRGSL